MAPPFQKVCETCHVMDIIISPIGDVHVMLIVQNQRFRKMVLFVVPFQ
jgi:hypothetical protein